MALISILKGICLNGKRWYSCCIGVNDVYILSAMRTPIGCFQGKLASLTAIELGSKALIAALEKKDINRSEIGELIVGCCLPTGLGQGPTHQIAVLSGLPSSTTCCILNKACGSGLKALIFACQAIMSNTEELVAAGGIESITHVPYILKRQNMRLGNMTLLDLLFYDGLIDKFAKVDVTNFAEETAKEYKCTREDQDEYALSSYAKAAKAQSENVFAAEMIPIVVKTKAGEVEIAEDEEVKRLNVEKFRQLKPDIGASGTITVGNSSGLGDAACMVVLASGNYVLKKNLTPLARVVSFAEGTLEPNKFVLAPSIAIPKALVKGNLTKESITRWEISETFALTTMVNTKILKINPDLVNIYGGAISLGHPFGMTGARLITHLAHTLCSGQLGCACISHAPGGAVAMIVEKL